MAFTFSKLATVTVGVGGAATMAFTNIPQNYKDLCIKMSSRANVDTVSSLISFNGVTTNLSVSNLYGTGSAAGSTSFSDARLYGDINSSTRTASTFANGEIYIPNYAGSTNKSISADAVEENNGTTAFAGLSAALWSSTAAITSITLTPQTGSYVQYSTATLYGIRAEV
jgi:hypothetical protein